MWKWRLERFRASGLTVARFCGTRRRVAAHVVLLVELRRIEISLGQAVSGRSSKALPLARQLVKQPPMTDGISKAAVVRFSWNAVEVSVPADCLAAIRCLAECFHSQHVQAESCDAFQEVVVRS